MSREMAAPTARMRLTVEVLPLTEENAHGPFSERAIAAFKGRKFALPVRLEDTFEQVWSQIEQRYKKNYLDAQQAANFTIKVLQDAYDCDLDLGDTVSSIFEGETDATKRMIKVVPSFRNRDFSVPATSNLRPGHAQKRARETNAEHANKRRRIDQHVGVQEELDPTCDKAVPSTESEYSREGSNLHHIRLQSLRAVSRSKRRSHTEGSLVIVHDAQTGHAEFSPNIKGESPELGLSLPPHHAPTTQPPTQPVGNRHSRPRSARPLSGTPRAPVVEVGQHGEPEIPETDGGAMEDVHEQATDTRDEALSRPDVEEVAIQPSPQSSSAPSQHTSPSAAIKRNDVYDVPSSPEFMENKIRAKTTYGRSPRTAATVKKEVALLNNSRLQSNDLTSAFLSDVAQPSPSKLDPEIQARLDRVNRLRLQRRRSPKTDNNDSSPSMKPTSTETKDMNGTKETNDTKEISDAKETSITKGINNKKETDGTATSWHAESWSFGGLDQPNGHSGQAPEDIQANLPQKAPVEVIESSTEPESDSESESEAPPVPDADSKSRSMSEALSTRSSPAVSRRPARFLSRSPTPEASASEAEVEEIAATPLKPASTPPAAEDDVSESSSSSDSDESSIEDEEEDVEENVEIPNVTKDATPNVIPNTAPNPLPSSPPPHPNNLPTSTPRVPETSQPTPSQLHPPIRQTPIPLPNNISQTPRSSQSVSAQAAARRPAPRFAGFRTLREQLADAKTPPTTSQKKAYDPRMMQLSKLAAKGKSAPALGVGLGGGDDDESSDESSSDSSSSSSDSE